MYVAVLNRTGVEQLARFSVTPGYAYPGHKINYETEEFDKYKSMEVVWRRELRTGHYSAGTGAKRGGLTRHR